MVRLGGNRIKTTSGKILHFGSKKKMDNWERVAKAVKHGFKPTKGK